MVDVWVAIEERLIHMNWPANDDKFTVSFLRGKKDKPMLVIWSYLLVIGFSLQMDWLARVIINIDIVCLFFVDLTKFHTSLSSLQFDKTF